MAAESFFQRWARRKAENNAAPAASAPVQAPMNDLAAANPAATSDADNAHAAGAVAPRMPTLDDVARLTADSDYSAFVSRGVDKSVRRAAMKKLFSDPHFNLMDGLDIYIGDYTKPDPIPPAMLAALQHTHNLFAPLPQPDEEDQDVGKEELASTPGSGERDLTNTPAVAPVAMAEPDNDSDALQPECGPACDDPGASPSDDRPQ